MRVFVTLIASMALGLSAQARQTDPQWPAQGQTAQQSQSQAQNPPQDANAQAQSNSIPAGTVVAIRTIDAVDSERDRQGQIYQASLSEDLVINGQTIARRGDSAEIRLRAVSQSGRLAGSAEVTLELSSVTINGKKVAVTSGDVSQDSKGKGKKTARNAGIGAVAGGLIGALAGGGKGAAIGMASGGALGAGASAVTKGPKVRIPSETVLRFTIAQSAAY